MQMQDRKAQLAGLYGRYVEELKNRREELKKHVPELREKIVEARDRFSETARINMAAIERRRISSQRMVDRIVGAARRSIQKQGVYGQSGKRQESGQKPVSVSINQTL